MPGIDGLEVCRILRRDSATARIPIIMLTASSAEVDRIVIGYRFLEPQDQAATARS